MSGLPLPAPLSTGLRFRLLNDWQHGFPLVDEPFAAIGAVTGVGPGSVIAGYRALRAEGAISRIGGAWGAGAGGAALLCAMAVPRHRLEAIAALVSAHPGVNHNYEREHRWNLWFVVTGRDSDAVTRAVDALDGEAPTPALRLPMRRVYRIDLGFDLREPLSPAGRVPAGPAAQVEPADAPLAALLEDGLPIAPCPYDAWGAALGQSGAEVTATLERWLRSGTLRRFGAIVRHHEAGFRDNAMTVFDVPDDIVDDCGERLAAQRGVTLAYRRERAPGWPYNLYCMVHGRCRAEVEGAIAAATAGAGLAGRERAVLFSVRRFKQSGASYFRGRAGEGVLHARR